MKKLPSATAHRIIKLAVSFACVLIISTLCLIIPLRPTVSETEKRELAKFPEFSGEALLSGDYFADISTWFSDTMPFRDTLMNLNSKMQNFLGTSGVLAGFNEGNQGDAIPETPTPGETLPEGETAQENTTNEPETFAPEEITYPADKGEAQHVEQLGSIVVCDNAGFEYYNFVQSTADNYVKALNTAGAKFSSIANVYATVVPTSTDITLNEKVRAKLSVSGQKQAIDYMLGSATGVKTFNCFNNIKQHRDEYVYFRTDHHWTALAAYYAYEIFCQAKGITPLPQSAYEIWSFEGFLGTFYNDSGKNPALGNTPDRVDAYKPPCQYSMTITDKYGSTSSMPMLYDETNAPASYKYGTFICGDNPLSTITNESLTDGEACLVIKESFGNAFVPFLVYHYKTVYVIDYRHYTSSLSSFLSTHTVNDIIFVNNVSMTRNSSLVSDLASFIAG